MAKSDTVPFIYEIKMGIDLHSMHRILFIECVDARDIDRIVAANHNRNCAACKDLAHCRLGIGMALESIGVHDIRFAHIDNPGLIGAQIFNVVLMVVGTGVTEGEQG